MKELIEKYANKIKLYYDHFDFYVLYNSKVRGVVGINLRGNDKGLSENAFEVTQQEFMYLKAFIISQLFTSYHIENDFLDYDKYQELQGIKFKPNKNGYYDEEGDWVLDSDETYNEKHYQWSDELDKAIPYLKSLPYFKDWIQSKEFIDEYGEQFLQTLLIL